MKGVLIWGGERSCPVSLTVRTCPQWQGFATPGQRSVLQAQKGHSGQENFPCPDPPPGPASVRTSGLLEVGQHLATPPCRPPHPTQSPFPALFLSPPNKAAHCPGSRKDSKTRLLHNSDPSRQRGRRGDLAATPAGTPTWSSITTMSSLHSTSPFGMRSETQGTVSTERRTEGV